MDKNNKQNKRLLSTQNFIQDPDLAIFDELQEINDHVEDLAEALKGVDISKLQTLPGAPGKTPKKGVDYFTTEDKTELAKAVQATIRVPKLEDIVSAVVPHIRPATNGTTPKKGIDYDDGKDGYSPKKGEDYFTLEEVTELKAELSTTLKALIPTYSGKDYKNALEALKGDDRLSAFAIKDLAKFINPQVIQSQKDRIGGYSGSANPFALLQSGVLKGKDARSINFTGATVTNNNGDFTVAISAASSLIITEVDGSPTGTPTTLKFSNGSVTDNGDGSFTIATGAGGGGDVSSNTTTTVDSEVALFSGAGGKTIKRATGTGLAKLTSGVLSTATAGTDYIVPTTAFTTGSVAFGGSSNQLTQDNAKFFWDDTNFRLGIGTATPGTALDIVGASIRQSSATADSTNKAFRFLTRNYLNAQNDFLMVFGQSKSTGNTLIIGGGQAGNTAASTISFFTGAGNNTDTGTSRMSIDDTNGVTISSATTFSAMTAKSILFAGTSGLLSQDNSYYKYDSTNHLVQMGSGTTTFSNSGATGGIIATQDGGNTFFVPHSGQNLNAGSTASTDYILGNDAATDTTNYSDFGINSSANTDTLYTLFGAGAAYWYNQSQDLAIATATSGKVIKIGVGGTLAANEVARFTATGMTVGLAGTTLGKIAFSGNTSGTTLLQSAAAASGTLTLPAGTGTVIATATNMATNPVTGTPSSSNFLRGDGTWATPAGGGFSDPLTTNGDIVARISGSTTRLAQGGNGTFLGVSGGTLGYYTPAGSGDMVLASAQTNSGVKTFLDTTLALRNVANTFSGVFTNTITAARTWTLKDASGTLAFTSDITGTNSGTNTGDQTITLTGGVTGSGTGSFAATVVTNANLTGVITSVGNATSIASQTGTGTKFVVDNTPTLITPVLGVATATSVTTSGENTLSQGSVWKLVTPTSDLTATGNIHGGFNSGYSSSAIGDLVYLDSATTWQKCDANTLALYNGLLGIALEVKSSGQALRVALPGSFIYSSTGFPSMTIGSPLYMSETPGAITHTQPTTTDAAIRVVGWAIHASKIFFMPESGYITHT